jgi:hypothetical protein
MIVYFLSCAEFDVCLLQDFKTAANILLVE